MAQLELHLDSEVWKVSPSFPLYEVSSIGRVRRLTTVTSTKAGRILRPAVHYSGYPHHGLGDGKKTLTVRLGRLVCEAFHGPCPSPAHECAHNDGNPMNSRADNVRWATKIENAADKERHGTTARGSMFRSAKLVESQVSEIKRRRLEGAPYKDLAAEFGVTTGLIGHIVRGRAWKHVEPVIVAAHPRRAARF